MLSAAWDVFLLAVPLTELEITSLTGSSWVSSVSACGALTGVALFECVLGRAAALCRRLVRAARAAGVTFRCILVI